MEFFLFVFGKSGVRCHPKRIEGVKKLQPPQNTADTLSFLSMMQYSSRFIRDFSSISEALRKLTRSSQPWEWNVEQQREFNLLKDRLCENIVNHYFDPTRHSTVVCDGSPVGVAAALYQTDDNCEMNLICFVSRALTAQQLSTRGCNRDTVRLVAKLRQWSMLANDYISICTTRTSLSYQITYR